MNQASSDDTRQDSRRPLLQRQADAVQAAPGRRLRRLRPWAISTFFHATVMITLALSVVSELTHGLPNAIRVTARLDRDLYDESLDLSPLEVAFGPYDGTRPDEELLSDSTIDDDRLSVELEIGLADDYEVVTIRPQDYFGGLRSDDLGKSVGSAQSAAREAGARIHEAGTVKQAVGTLVGDIDKELDQGELLVVWMFDASISLVDDRQRVAVELGRFIEKLIAQEADDSPLCMQVAVAFSGNAWELVAPTRPTRKIVDAVRSVPVDTSGVENVLGAVEWAVRRYGKRWKQAMKIVVWTDESGDDLGRLERTIAVCRQRQASVSVVGPSAILGRRQGTHSWMHAPTGEVLFLPVNRGSESFLPQRLRLPYWFKTKVPHWSASPRRGAIAQNHSGQDFPAWYGGDQLEGLVSGFGPYGLVRLAVETGGTYTILDRPADRGPFRLDVMRPYLPDYRSADEITEELKYHPLRQAVVAAAALTLQDSNLQPPETNFFGRSARYDSPAGFRRNLKDSVDRQQAAARHIVETAEQALAEFGPEGLEDLYGAERSPRWKAWYDLTRGRLLAVQVRCVEYAYARGLLWQSLEPNTNYASFQPAGELRCGPITQPLADEARRLLERCLRDNPNTPWAYLAQRELDYPLGIAVTRQVIPRPPNQAAVPVRPAAPRGRINAPSL